MMDMETTFRFMFHRVLNYTWQDYMSIATDYDLLTDLKWCRTRPASKTRRAAIQNGTDTFGDDVDSYLGALSHDERDRIQRVWDRFPSEAVDTKHIQTVMTRRGSLPVMMKGAGLLVSPLPDRAGDKRWLHNSELLTAMGHPISLHAQEAAGAKTQFSVGHLAPVARTHSSTTAQLGNSWHVGMFGSISLMMAMKLPDLGLSHPLIHDGDKPVIPMSWGQRALDEVPSSQGSGSTLMLHGHPASPGYGSAAELSQPSPTSTPVAQSPSQPSPSHFESALQRALKRRRVTAPPSLP